MAKREFNNTQKALIVLVVILTALLIVYLSYEGLASHGKIMLPGKPGVSSSSSPVV